MGCSGREAPMSTPPVPAPELGALKVVCTVPTYNEAENIVPLARELLELGPGFEVLVIDDDSPDGTWRLVQEAARDEPRLHLLHRTTERGRGAAGRDGFVEALRLGADVVVEMDGDFSHQPRFVPQMLERLDQPGAEAGLVLGSRAVSGGRDADRGALRQVVTKLANLYIRILLGVGVRDCNSGFRCWRRSTLEAIDVGSTFSRGPAIVQELLFKTARRRIPIAEVPIEFVDRVRGESTLTLRILLQGYLTVMKLRWMAIRGRI